LQLIRNCGNCYKIKLNEDLISGILEFDNPGKCLTILTKNLTLNGITISGFKGVLNIPSLDLSNFRNNIHKKVTFSMNNHPMLNHIIKSLKFKLLIKLNRFTLKDPKLVQVHRDSIINISLDSTFGSEYEQIELGKQVEVKVIGCGYRKLGDLCGKSPYFEYNKTGTPTSKSQLAASMGFIIILATSKQEVKLIKKITGAEYVNQLDNSKLKEIETIQPKTPEERDLLRAAINTLSLMLNDTNSLFTEENHPANRIPSDKNYINSPLPPYEINESNMNEILVTHYNSKNFQYHDKSLNQTKSRKSLVNLSHNESISKIGRYQIGLCKLARDDINAIVNPGENKIFINLESPIIKKILLQKPEIQRIMLIEEISHELTHILGYGLEHHDEKFFKTQRILKYKAILNLD
jgi:hypothetical protein